MVKKTSCDRCGACCLQGGAALHTQDLQLIQNKKLTYGDLVTVRQGELAFQPMASEAGPVAHEFLKLQGKPGSWSCKFYDDDFLRCSIYQDRPLACRVLECTAPEALLTITGKNLITRFDCIDENDPLLPLIREHDTSCPCPDLSAVSSKLDKNGTDQELLQSLEATVNLDLRYRTLANRKFKLPVASELFYFGRPLFQLLAPLGIAATQQEEALVLSFNNRSSR